MTKRTSADYDLYAKRLGSLLTAIDENPLVAAPHTKILNRDGKLVPFEPTEIQEELARRVLLDRWVIDLKARQIGSTTVLVFLLFMKAMLTPGYKVLIVAQGHKAATTIFKMVHTFYQNMNPILKVPHNEINKTTIEFRHKGLITVTSANSNSVRGSTYQAVLGSEVAFWPNPLETVASIFQVVSGRDDTIIVLESTPNMANYFYYLWSRNTHGMHKFFAPWTQEPTYTMDVATHPITDQLLEYGKEHNLTDGQLNWAATALAVKCLGNWATFKQEYAVDDKTCFITSGDNFFEVHESWLTQDDGEKIGWLTLPRGGVPKWGLDTSIYNPAAIYSVGVDPASGSATGDYSTIAVCDVTNKNRPYPVATFMGRLTPKQLLVEVRIAARAFNALTVVERTGGWGTNIIDALMGSGINQYREITIDAGGAHVSTSYGFLTSSSTRGPLLAELQHLVNNGHILIGCPRLKSQMSKYAYVNGRPDHVSGEHDDLIFALALAIKGGSRAREEFKSATKAMPTSHEEMARWERVYGKPFKTLVDEGMFESNEESDQFQGW